MGINTSDAAVGGSGEKVPWLKKFYNKIIDSKGEDDEDGMEGYQKYHQENEGEGGDVATPNNSKIKDGDDFGRYQSN